MAGVARLPASVDADAGKSVAPGRDVPAQDAWLPRLERWAEPASVAAPCRQALARFGEQSFAAKELSARAASRVRQPLAGRVEASAREALRAAPLAQESPLRPRAALRPADVREVPLASSKRVTLASREEQPGVPVVVRLVLVAWFAA